MSYNGWSNYETWVTKLWLDNEQSSYVEWTERAEQTVRDADGDTDTAVYKLAEELKDEISNSSEIPEYGLFADLLNAALSEVDWQEIAQAYVGDVDMSEYEQETEDVDA